ncbi:hypothetical protein RHGRI_030384 [Rhododendron griersonianum]|uniref:NADP-dependent glyceraldehyde-3-phosphate dehydrogenase n=1 Tax=Rhododendron griersonianum TaxID=479676 RepID=A0AAV6IR21_9ERIC|nr:hypothetical protein RHGRI_030384 [Rhododendron griersonianum]
MEPCFEGVRVKLAAGGGVGEAGASGEGGGEGVVVGAEAVGGVELEEEVEGVSVVVGATSLVETLVLQFQRKQAGMVPLQMELGGKDACIVLEDADLDLVAANVIKGGFSNSGQRCSAVKVVLAMESIADSLVEKVNAKVAKLTVGSPEVNCDITPVVTESSANFIEGLVMDGKKKGATFCQEYKRDGNLIWPLLLDNVRPDMRIAWEEPFGPVLPVTRINTVEEVIHHCNASNFGLQDGMDFESSHRKKTEMFLMRLTKDESEVNLAIGEADREFSEWKWASPDEVIEQDNGKKQLT